MSTPVDLEAARKLAEEATCGACMGTGVKDQDCPPEEVDDDIPCPECSGTGRHPLADLVLSLIPEAERARTALNEEGSKSWDLAASLIHEERKTKALRDRLRVALTQAGMSEMDAGFAVTQTEENS